MIANAAREAFSAAIDARRIEEAGLNALQTQRQLFFDGWLLRLSPGSAKRARSVNAHFGSSLPTDAKVDRCETLYASAGLPTLFRITPFSTPADLDAVLDRRGYVAFDHTLVQLVTLPRSPLATPVALELEAVRAAAFVDAVAALRGSSRLERDAHLERLANTPLVTRAVVVRSEDRVVACGQLALDQGLAGVYDMVTAAASRGRGLATAIVADLLDRGAKCGATHAFLQVNEDNAAARAVYRKFGFATVYAYHYRARPSECR